MQVGCGGSGAVSAQRSEPVMGVTQRLKISRRLP
jgi:hypothetical protein